jgi:malonyl CoA-acyl carrier protein transacylase/acyl carrier protein
VAGLTKAFRDSTEKRNFCALGSVKSNLGHLDTTAGMAGLIKTVLMLQHRQLLPTVHFTQPNPRLKLPESPFYVNTSLREWASGPTPRRAGISSFGIGGTNAHVVLEEAPPAETSSNSRPFQLLVLSARTKSALELSTARLAARLKNDPSLPLADVANTLQLGRREFAHRRIVAARDTADALSAFDSLDPKRVLSGLAENEDREVVFMFPGQGAQQVNMGLELYRHEPVFRQQVDQSCDLLKPILKMDLRTVLYPPDARIEWAKNELQQTAMTQPALFVIEHALAQLWMQWGLKPRALIGHSIGEYVAACLAGVFSLDDALALVAARGRMMQDLPIGMMLAIRLPESDVRAMLGADLSLAAVNGSSLCVVSGPSESVQKLADDLNRQQLACRHVRTSHAFHSSMMDPILAPFAELVGKLTLNAPQIPFISNVTGTFAGSEVESPNYWSRHLRETVRFADGIGELLQDPACVLLEVGPGHTLTTAAQQHPARTPAALALASMYPQPGQESEYEAILNSVGRLWLAGATLDWSGFQAGEKRKRVSLPTYPFERQRYCIEPLKIAPVTTVSGPEPLSAVPAEDPSPLARQNGNPLLAELKSLLSEMSGLRLDLITDDSSFVDLGFDSLFLTQVSVALGKKFQVKIAFRQLIERFNTPRTLATHLETARGGQPDDPTDPAPTPQPKPDAHHNPRAGLDTGDGTSRTLERTIPLAPGQKELWFASQVSDASSCTYNECRLIHLRGLFDTDALCHAIDRVVARHEALRTTIAANGECQHIFTACPVDIARLNFSDLPETERERELDSIEQAEARTPFDLVNGPLLRVRLAKLAPRHHVLIVSIHHIVCDGTSFGILMGDLGELYSAEREGRESRLPAPLQLSDYVRGQTPREDSASSDEAYWLNAYSDVPPPMELPLDHPRPPLWNRSAARVSLTLPAAVQADLRRLTAQEHCTTFTTLLAAFTVYLHRLTGQPELVVGVPVAGRAMEGSHTLVGHCINFLPLRCRIHPDASFNNELRDIQRTFLDAHEHQGFSFGELVQKLSLPRSSDRMPLVSVTFNVDRIPENQGFAGLEVELIPSGRSFSNFDLGFNLAESNRELKVDCRFNTALFDTPTIHRWLGHFQTLLESIVQDPLQAVSRLKLLTAAERSQLIDDWNATAVNYPGDKCIHQLIEDQVLRTPDATAIACGPRRVSYRELNVRANRLARRLCDVGVGPDVSVGVCVDRTIDMVVGILAILKAGGAYVPLPSGFC